MINIAICDDDINVAKEIESLIKSTINSQIYSTSIYIEAEEFSKVDYAKLDFVFLDIELGDISGIEIATQIRKVNESVIIFFITNHSRYISEALKSMPFQYILKPISEKKELFFEEFYRGIDKLKKIKQTIIIDTLYGEEIVRVDSIRYIEYLNRKIIIHTDKKEICFIGKLSEWNEKLLPYNFVQCHKSFLVNLNHIDKIRFAEIIMDNNMNVPIGRKYSQYFAEERNKFLAGIRI